MLEYCLGLCWGDTAVGLVHYWTRSVMAGTRALFGRLMYFFLFHIFIACIKETK
jgi:hypothetical protein